MSDFFEHLFGQGKFRLSQGILKSDLCGNHKTVVTTSTEVLDELPWNPEVFLLTNKCDMKCKRTSGLTR